MATLQQGDVLVSYTDESSGPPAVLLHSGGLSARQWSRLATRLAPTRRVLAPDLIGYGASRTWPADAPFHLDEDARQIEALLDAVGGPFDLVGHSYGGLLALRIASRRPSQVRSLALFEPVAFGVLYEPRDEEAFADLARTDPDGTFLDDATGGDERWLTRFVDYWNGAGAWASLPEPSREGFRRAGRKVFQEVRSIMEDRTAVEAYRSIEAPALFLMGERSPRAVRHACARIAAAMPHARAVTVEGAGHMGPITHVAAVNEAIAQHIAAASP